MALISDNARAMSRLQLILSRAASRPAKATNLTGSETVSMRTGGVFADITHLQVLVHDRMVPPQWTSVQSYYQAAIVLPMIGELMGYVHRAEAADTLSVLSCRNPADNEWRLLIATVEEKCYNGPRDAPQPTCWKGMCTSDGQVDEDSPAGQDVAGCATCGSAMTLAKKRPPVARRERRAKRATNDDIVDIDADQPMVGRPGVKAGAVGGFGLLVLLLMNLLSLPLLACLVVPGYVVVLVVTGMLAGLLANDQLSTRRQAARLGVTAGFVAGICGGVIAVLLAALGLMFPDLGQGVLAQFSPAQLANLARMGITSDTIRLAGSVLFALLLWGAAGTAVAMILSFLGGRLYFRLR